MKRLYRSRTDKVIGGVCGGLGEYFETDPVLFRIGAVLLVLLHGSGLLLYLVMLVAVPKRPIDAQPVPSEHRTSSWTRYLPGAILIFIGLIFLVRDSWFWFDIHRYCHAYWPVLLIAVGLALLLMHGRSHRHDPHSQMPEPPATPQNGGAIA